MDKNRIIEIVTDLYYIGLNRGSEWTADYMEEILKGADNNALEAWKAHRSSADKDRAMETVTNAISRIFEAAEQTTN